MLSSAVAVVIQFLDLSVASAVVVAAVARVAAVAVIPLVPRVLLLTAMIAT